ncbi:alpha-amylase family glycosyl hydrolase [Geodermatophilus sp. DSM 45219]|uniref:alpha-amylase family glycosyl hydrolase n=1 Tax=Geodermatophilus sp. DSM 45219 TaxID=1881103 RepID=UPI00088A1E94|nr:alpha-amylase family glycosyl hydrolase [Geodermatophilus sp. DSM 45219]SDN77146.1 alpha-glucosidase [Geodermatophilus sp. DSM 45219]
MGTRTDDGAPPWWQRGAVYQVYPRSFADSDGDGVGDLRGLRAHLDHLADLSVAAVWLSPVFPSPMADFGYDVSDLCDVDPLFGTLADLDDLVADCHARGIRVVLDWVPNHTSDQHPWFRASRSSRADPKRDWYVWRDGAPDGGPPNDWRSEFAAVGPAWARDEATGQWYLHSYTPQQPDLNWENPEVEAAMHDVVRFWLGRGVDGLRIDALQRLAKDPLLRSNAGGTRRHDQDWETAHERLRGIRRVVDEFPDRMIVGEVYLLDLPRVAAYLAGGDQLHLAHNFVFLHLPWDADAFRTTIEGFESLVEPETWPAWFLGNHDHSRVATRYDDGGHGPARARAVALLLTALRGTPFLFQGDELGLPDAVVPPDRVVDVDGRDPERAPIPWRPPSVAGPGAGFTTAEPWLPLVADAERLCVERQAADPSSTLSLVRELGALRASSRTLQTGAQRFVDAGPGVLAWLREGDGERLLAAVDFATGPRRLPLDAAATLLVSTDPERTPGPVRDLELRPDEAVLLRLSGG